MIARVIQSSLVRTAAAMWRRVTSCAQNYVGRGAVVRAPALRAMSHSSGGSIMVGNRYWMPPPRQFQPMFQVSLSNQTVVLHPVPKIQLVMYTISLQYNLWYLGEPHVLVSRQAKQAAPDKPEEESNLFTAVNPAHLRSPESVSE